MVAISLGVGVVAALLRETGLPQSAQNRTFGEISVPQKEQYDIEIPRNRITQASGFGSGFRRQASGFRLQASGVRRQASGFRLQDVRRMTIFIAASAMHEGTALLRMTSGAG